VYQLKSKIIFIFLITALLAVSAIAFSFWQEIQKFEPKVYYHVPANRSFFRQPADLKHDLENRLLGIVRSERSELIEKKKSFIYADLEKMELILYRDGEEFKNFPIRAIGADWFWGETPPGIYSVEDKSTLSFSSIANVWMPYAIQYYGNYLIHGWPFHRDGRLIVSEVSGGCIRLNTKDAAVVFEFAQIGMPILVFDEIIRPPMPALIPTEKEILPPNINGQAFLAADLQTGEIIFSKEADSQFYADSAARVMFALALAQSVNLERTIVARSWMFEDVNEGIIIPGKRYRGHELLSLLLLNSSKEAALVLSRFITAEEFVRRMNSKAKGIGMENSHFVDITGTSRNNAITLNDMAKMMRFIKDYRNFILDISSQWRSAGKNEKETVFKLLEMKAPENLSRFIFIGVINSASLQADLENISSWLENNLHLKL
jgi:lipoprotein-anchoring transpeptidase ErfK/SrfK